MEIFLFFSGWKDVEEDQLAMTRVGKALEEKPKIEEEIKNGLKIQEDIKAREDAFLLNETKAKDVLDTLKKKKNADETKAQDTLKALNDALEKAKQDIRDEENKVIQEIAAAKSNLETMRKQHLEDIMERKENDQYRSDIVLKNLSKRLEGINGSMKTLREFVIIESSELDED